MKNIRFYFAVLILLLFISSCKKDYEYTNVQEELNYQQNCGSVPQNKLIGEWENTECKKSVYTINSITQDTTLFYTTTSKHPKQFLCFRNCSNYQSIIVDVCDVKIVTSGDYSYCSSTVFHDTLKFPELDDYSYHSFQLTNATISGNFKPWVFIKDIGELSIILYSKQINGNQYTIYEYFYSGKLK